MKKSKLLILIFVVFNFTSYSQNYTIRGRVTDLQTGYAIPFASVGIKGKNTKISANENGEFKIAINSTKDSIYAHYLGYNKLYKKAKKVENQVINFELEASTTFLNIVVVAPKKIDPAVPVMKKVIASRNNFNKDQLETVQYKNYSKFEFDIDNMTDRIRKWKILKPVVSYYDSLDAESKSKEKTLPVYFAEVYSDIYYLKSPRRKKEVISAIKVNYVGKDEKNIGAQLVDSDFDNYNFYYDDIEIMQKPFFSPFANNAFLFYNYYMLDSAMVNGKKIYEIRVKPKEPQDPVFTGKIWIVDSLFVACKLDLEITKEVNFNLVESVKIEQELIPTSAGPWIPNKTKVVIDYADLTKDFVSGLLKIYQSADSIVVNNKLDTAFYSKPVAYAENVFLQPDSFWIQKRTEPLNKKEALNYSIIDTVRNIKIIKRTIKTLYFLGSGYRSIGFMDVGHYITFYTYNNYEGSRLKLDFKSNEKLSKDWVFRSYVAYGVKDEAFKFNVQLEKIISRFPWAKAGAQYRSDISQLGTSFDYTRNQNIGSGSNLLYLTGSQFGVFSKLVRSDEKRLWYETNFKRGISPRITFQHITTTPLFSLVTNENPFNSITQEKYSVSELLIDAKITEGELFVQNGNERVKIGSSKKPVLNFNYTVAIKNLFGGDYGYHKISANYKQKKRWPIIGVSTLNLKAGKVFSTVPFTLLEVHRGNQTYFFSPEAYNLMNWFEFVSDQYASVQLQHNFNGLLFNRIPLIDRLKWRENIGASILYGNLSAKNKVFNQNNRFSEFSKLPYVELNAGINNIFGFIKVDFIYRLTYTDKSYLDSYYKINPIDKISKYGIKFSLQFGL